MDMQTLRRASKGRSQRSLFRDLVRLGYFSSYTHAGRYYTLADIPDFNEHGLWRYQDIGFSRRGTLKATVAWRVQEGEAGCTHVELQTLLRLQVHSTLLGLVRQGVIGRERVGGVFVYVAADEELAARQLDARRKQAEEDAERPLRLPPDEVVLVVLVEALHAAGGLAAPGVVAARLVARGEVVAPEQVEHVYSHFGLVPGKKTAEPP